MPDESASSDRDHPASTTAPQPSVDRRASTYATRGMSRRAFLGLVGLGAVAAAGGSMTSTYRFQVERIAVSHASISRPLTIAWLCDMHFGPFIHAGSVAAWVDATLDLAPDLVLLGSDLVDQYAPEDLSPLITHLRRLRAPLGVYSVLGNHEYARFGRGPALESFMGELKDAGIVTLVDRGVPVRDDLYLAGVDAAGGGFGRIGRALAQRPPATACLVAAHKPDVLPHMPADVELTLCGHTHGGQVRLPGIGPVLVDSRLSRDYSSGWYRTPSLGYVSRGLGVGHLPLRIACPAELTVATLTPA